MPKNLFPFVSISGVNSSKTMNKIKGRIPKLSHHVVAGLLTTTNTLKGRKEKNHPDRFVDNKTLLEIVNTKNKIPCIIHHRSTNESNLFDDLVKITSLVGDNILAIQIDAIHGDAFADPIVLSKFKEKFPSTNLILQVGPMAFEEVKNNPLFLRKKLEKYKDFISGVLLDKSDSRGILLNAKYLTPFVEEIYHRMPQYNVIIAGGLNSSTMKKVLPLLKINPLISIDAESVFFIPGKTKGSELFNALSVKEYLRSFKEILKFNSST